MENIYNILWIDDEHESLGGTKARARRNGIKLIAYKSLNGGMSELERNYAHYDGVLLDAKFFENEDDISGTEDTYNIHRAKEQLLQLKKKFEIFVLTGQAEAYEDNTFKKAFTKVYKKGSDSETDRLFNDIKEAASKQADTQLRHLHKRVFDVCTDRYIGDMAAQDLLNLLSINQEFDINTQFNTYRKIIEDLFLAFNKYQLLPNEFVYPSVAINPASKFLCGKDSWGNMVVEKNYQHGVETHLPPKIAAMLKYVVTVTQEGSHRSEVDTYVSELKTPYLAHSILFQLMDIIVWFKLHVDAGPETENWTKVNEDDQKSEDDIKIGIVINHDANKGYAFFKPEDGTDNVFIPSNVVSENNLEEGNTVKVEIERYHYARLNEIRKRVKKIIEKAEYA
ncbi:S1 domain-containing protein [Aestuariibaculum marinum]|uniref:Uncharacterized protein n=1 Tax=Aestuariibaculum marinum TaxID=2683592 RepID=A0A8J6U4U7_9FLAO|nr:hypothetical protein [Aestuariibaculum marinum]MBD0824425.1 hypothetical protein [Aestuariibaculum marinum]